MKPDTEFCPAFQPLAFDQVLPAPGEPEVLLRDERGDYWLQIYAPELRRLSVLCDPELCEAQRGADGVWRLKLPYRSGMHYLKLYFDGVDALSPCLPIAYGYSRPCNYVALEEEEPSLALRDVPHGRMSREFFYSEVTGSWESCQIYTPPGYEDDVERVWPVLYLQHGHGENETSWGSAGRLPIILDNLIAAGACRPFAVVMNNGMVQKTLDGRRVVDFTLFEPFLLEDVIPYIERRYRIGGARERRAMAGLSMGSLQTAICAFSHPDLFSHVGIFSGFLHDFLRGSELDMIERGPGDDRHLALLRDPERFDRAFRVFFRAIGDADPFLDYFLRDDERCEGIRQDRRIYPGGHDWNVWRLCLRDFAKLLFQEGSDTV